MWARQEVLATPGKEQQIAAHQHSGTWLLRYGLLLYSCLRSEATSWSSMPIRQPERLQLLTTGWLPAIQCNTCVQHWASCICLGFSERFLSTLSETDVCLEGEVEWVPYSNWPLPGVCLLYGSVVWQGGQQGTNFATKRNLVFSLYHTYISV